MKTQNELFITRSYLERVEEDKRAMLVQFNNALSETEVLKSKVDNINDMFGCIESSYKALEQEHEVRKQEVFNFKSESIQVKRKLPAVGSTLEMAQRAT